MSLCPICGEQMDADPDGYWCDHCEQWFTNEDILEMADDYEDDGEAIDGFA